MNQWGKANDIQISPVQQMSKIDVYDYGSEVGCGSHWKILTVSNTRSVLVVIIVSILITYNLMELI